MLALRAYPASTPASMKARQSALVSGPRTTVSGPSPPRSAPAPATASMRRK